MVQLLTHKDLHPTDERLQRPLERLETLQGHSGGNPIQLLHGFANQFSQSQILGLRRRKP